MYTEREEGLVLNGKAMTVPGQTKESQERAGVTVVVLILVATDVGSISFEKIKIKIGLTVARLGRGNGPIQEWPGTCSGRLSLLACSRGMQEEREEQEEVGVLTEERKWGELPDLAVQEWLSCSKPA
jgi:hypothetical protein